MTSSSQVQKPEKIVLALAPEAPSLSAPAPAPAPMPAPLPLSEAPEFKALQESMKTFSREILCLQNDSRTEFEKRWSDLADSIKKTLDAFTQRIEACEKAPPAAVAVETPAAPVEPPPSAPDYWDATLKQKEAALENLKAVLSKIPETVEPPPALELAAAPEPAPAPVEPSTPASVPEKQIDLAEAIRKPAILSRLWHYLNEAAIEIPTNRTKDPNSWS